MLFITTCTKCSRVLKTTGPIEDSNIINVQRGCD